MGLATSLKVWKVLAKGIGSWAEAAKRFSSQFQPLPAPRPPPPKKNNNKAAAWDWAGRAMEEQQKLGRTCQSFAERIRE